VAFSAARRIQLRQVAVQSAFLPLAAGTLRQ
jgi:hypothetical protein